MSELEWAWTVGPLLAGAAAVIVYTSENRALRWWDRHHTERTGHGTQKSRRQH